MQRRITVRHENGLAFVPLSNCDRTVVLDEAALEELISLGAHLRWNYSGGLVWLFMGNKKIGVARLIVDSGKHERIMYLNGNPLDLTMANLVRGRGSSTKRARDCIVRNFKSQIKIDHDVR